MRWIIVLVTVSLALLIGTAAPVVAGTTELVKDIVPGRDGSDPVAFTKGAGTILFAADGDLWKTDGSTAGTQHVEGPGMPKGPVAFGTLGDTAFFTGCDAVHGCEFWKTKGTAATTQLVKEIAPGICRGIKTFREFLCSSTQDRYSRLGDELYFVNQWHELWKTDGTEAGTAGLFVDHRFFGSRRPEFITFKGAFYFQGWAGPDVELWKTDGTTAGTVLVKDINPGGWSDPRWFTKVGDALFFMADVGRGQPKRTELWKTDGTEAGTVSVKAIPSGWSDPGMFTNVGGTLFFRAEDGKRGRELWTSDGTKAGTRRVKDIRPGPKGSRPSRLTAVGDTLYFTASDGKRGRELWKSDGTAAGTKRVRDIRKGRRSSSPTSLAAVGDTVFFAADDGKRGSELWQSNGTSSSTRRVRDIWPGTKSSKPAQLTNIGGTIYFSARTYIRGRELWKHVP